MANNTDAGIAPGGDGEFGTGASAPGPDSDRPSSPSFGDPDQYLYGGGWHGSPSPTTPAETSYEGRHRAVD